MGDYNKQTDFYIDKTRQTNSKSFSGNPKTRKLFEAQEMPDVTATNQTLICRRIYF